MKGKESWRRSSSAIICISVRREKRLMLVLCIMPDPETVFPMNRIGIQYAILFESFCLRSLHTHTLTVVAMQMHNLLPSTTDVLLVGRRASHSSPLQSVSSLQYPAAASISAWKQKVKDEKCRILLLHFQFVAIIFPSA